MKTVESVKLLKWGLELMQRNLDPLGYDDTSLLSCMTLDVENLHSVVHHKNHPKCLQLSDMRATLEAQQKIYGGFFNQGITLRTFAPIATAHLQRTRYSLGTCVSRHVFQARTPSRNSTKYRADDLCLKLVCGYFCWMLGDPHFFSADQLLF